MVPQPSPALAFASVDVPTLAAAVLPALALAAAGAGVVLASFALVPHLVALLRTTRPLPAGVRADLELPADAAVRVVESESPDAFAAGVLPGGERVYLTDGLVAESPRDEVAAVVAHELGHVAGGHARQRCGLLAGVAAGCTLLGPGLGATGPALAGFAAGVAALAWLARRQERAADEYAARRAGVAASLRALGRRDRGAAGPLSRACAWLGVRTPAGRRADRLET